MKKILKKIYKEGFVSERKNRRRGFTLIELLVSISIISVLISLALVSYGGAQKQTRDTQRKSDLSQYRNGLQAYAAAHGNKWPYSGASGANVNLATNTCTTYLSAEGHMSACPADPGTTTYYYSSNGSAAGATAIQYIMFVATESPSGNCWEVCSDGRSGLLGAACPTTAQSGACGL